MYVYIYIIYRGMNIYILYSFSFLRLRMEETASIYGEQLRISTRGGSVSTGLGEGLITLHRGGGDQRVTKYDVQTPT
jgi:hypothetical protein